MRLQLYIPPTSLKDDFKTTPKQLKALLTLTLVRRWSHFLALIFPLTKTIISCIQLPFNDLYHLRAFSSVG